ncbi:TlpA disulfide reductase family protein [Chitinophaga agri]|uniref:AhpC/TSA family protein n=1 Tax=Chitinophaga agri TaxID=2703787 RepID=A0A6B9ZLT3_9BACT|nr:TlpA disulfide reductase family protein [Chitinophaga agri]QHS62877.1 AhpC/TSA family protein [Chitinophaga agri]
MPSHFSGFLLLLCCLIGLSSHAQERFTVRGTVPHYNGKIYFDNEGHTDTVLIKDKKFLYEGTIDRPFVLWFRIDAGIPISGNTFILEPGETVISMDTIIRRTGEDTCEISLKYQKMGPVNKVLVPYEKRLKIEIPKIRFAPEEEQLRFVMNDMRTLILKNRQSLAPYYYIINTGIYQVLPEGLLDSAYRDMPVAYKNGYFGQQLKRHLEYLDQTRVGQPMKDFTLTDLKGNTIHISDYKGKFVLVDVWASWCQPCRAEIPFLKTVYGKYHGQQFDILALSIDYDRQPWIDAVQKEQITWANAIDARGFDAELMQYFRVSSVPFNMLLDPNGIVIAVNLHGERLAQKLEELLPGKK